MKIYFSATVTDNSDLKKMYKLIKDYLAKEGHKVFEYGSDQIDPSELAERSDNEISQTFKDLDKYLRNADILIADISLSSVGIGYEISQAIMMKKPVLVLKYQKSNFEPLATIEGNKSAYLRYKVYNESSIEYVLKNFLIEAKDKVNTKFILIIPAEIDRYLEWNVREKGVSKAEVTRLAVEKIMENDEAYARYMKTFEDSPSNS
jgi:hypothetical protein